MVNRGCFNKNTQTWKHDKHGNKTQTIESQPKHKNGNTHQVVVKQTMETEKGKQMEQWLSC